MGLIGVQNSIDAVGGGVDGIHVWFHDIEWLGGDGVGVGHGAGTSNADAIDGPVWELIELEIDELVDLAGWDVGLDAAFGGGKEISVGGDGAIGGELINDGNEDILLILDAMEIAVAVSFASAGVGEATGAVYVDGLVGVEMTHGFARSVHVKGSIWRQVYSAYGINHFFGRVEVEANIIVDVD